MTKGTKLFPARLQLRPSTSSFVAGYCSYQFNQMVTASLKMFHPTQWGMLTNEACFPVIILSGDHVWSYVQDESTARLGMFTNHELQLYVQRVYKTQSENFITISTTNKSSERINLCRDIKSKLKCFQKPLKSDFLCIDETNKIIHNTKGRYSHKIRLLRPSHPNMQGLDSQWSIK